MAQKRGVWVLLRAHPIKTCIFLVGPLLATGAQFANAYYHDLSLVFPTGFALLMLGGSTMALRHHLAETRLAVLQDEYRWE